MLRAGVRPLCLTDDTLTALSPLSRLETLDLSFASQLSNDAGPHSRTPSLRFNPLCFFHIADPMPQYEASRASSA